MKYAILAGICWIALIGCTDTQDPVDTSLRFERVEVDGVTTDHASTGGVSWVDHDGDGDLDLFVSNGYDVSATPAGQRDRLYRNDGDGAFTAIDEGPLATGAAISSGHTWGDYDGDGDRDVFIANQQDQDNLLLRNDGDAGFTPITDEPMTTGGGHSYAAAWIDYDGDGRLDLFVANGGMSHVGANGLYRGLGDGRFEQITTGAIATDEAATCGIAWGDYDDDGDSDLFVANNGFAPPANNNALYRNDGGGAFTRITDSPAVDDATPSAAATWVDVDNDLDLDLHVTTMYGMADLLYLNDGSGGLTPAPASPLNVDPSHGYGASWEDLDNDGDVDVVVANWGAGTSVFLNDGSGRFERASVGDLGSRVEYAGAVASGDYDGDGHVDVYIGNWPNVPGPGEPNSLYRGVGGDGHWLRVRLTGGFGARVLVTTNSGTQMREVGSQAGFRGQSDPSPHFGLGEDSQVMVVEVRWSSGKVSTVENVAADQVVEVVEPAVVP